MKDNIMERSQILMPPNCLWNEMSNNEITGQGLELDNLKYALIATSCDCL